MKTLPEIGSGAVTQTGGFMAANGAATAQSDLFSGLAQASRRLRQELQPVLDQHAASQASKDVLQAARDRDDNRTALDVPVRFALTQQDGVYNDIVTAGVYATARADIGQEVARLGQKFQSDPAGFTEAKDAFIKSYTAGLSKRSLNGRTIINIESAAIQAFAAEGQRIEEFVQQAQVKETQDGLQRRLDQINAEVATLLERDGIDAVTGEAYEALEREAINIVDILVENPVYGWSGERGAEAIDGLMTQATEIVNIQGMEATYHAKGAGAALEFIDQAVEGMTLDQSERIGARSRLAQRLNVLQQMTALDEAERQRINQEEIDKLEQTAFAFEGELLQRMGAGERPTQGDLAFARALVSAGAMSPSRMGVYVNAATADANTASDDTAVASLFDYAREPGVTREDIELATTDAVGQNIISASERETILNQHAKANDTRLRAGSDLLDGFFATGFLDIDTGSVRASKALAQSDLEAWFDRNPDATVEQVEQKARQLAVAAGRRMPRPPGPDIPGLQGARGVTIQTVGNWSDEARLMALEAYEDDPAALNRAMQEIDELEAWVMDQQRFQQENVNNVGPND